jgi:hypothetical protein
MSYTSDAHIIGTLFQTKSDQYPLAGIINEDFSDEFMPETDEGTIWSLLTGWTEDGTLELFAIQSWADPTEEGRCPYGRVNLAILESQTTRTAIHYTGDIDAGFVGPEGITPRVLLKSRVSQKGKPCYCVFAVEPNNNRTKAPKKAMTF